MSVRRILWPHRPLFARILAAAVLALPASAQAHKELGRMWAFDHLPVEFYQEAYGFTPSSEWLEHARLSSLQFGDGCSASFVSPRGLILTNHHCARDYVATLAPEGRNWLNDGFFVASLAEEVPIPDFSVQQLVSIRDVTSDVNAGLSEDMDANAKQARRGENRKAILDRAAAEQPQLQSRIVSLYQGGLQHLYQYKVYDDVRLVGAPHLQCAKFGGDPDNFTYPRFGLDFALCRAYENGQPADTTAHYLRWKSAGPSEGEAVFVIGRPGSTGRLKTLAQMEYLRDVELPSNLERIHAMLDSLHEQAEADGQRAAETEARVLDLENARKAYQGFLDGLRNPAVLERKRLAEDTIRNRIEADPVLKERFGTAWSRMEEVVAAKKEANAAGDRQRLRDLRQQEQEAELAVGEAYFAVYGREIPPDATATMRVSDGVVTGFPYNGTIAPWFTSLYGLYARWTEFAGREPFDLPQVWIDKRTELDLSTPFNFVSSCDIIGGNSGSPIIDRNGDLVGLVFDGNIEMLGNMYVYTDEVARSVAVHPAIIMEALRRVYGVQELADELEGKGAGYR